jgi:hypothetical protein
MKRCSYGLVLILAAVALQVAAQEPVSPVPDGKVARAQFTSAVENHEPVDRVVTLSPPAEEVFFFTDLRNLEGRTVTHVWQYGGEVVSKKSFEVKGPRWRVFSKKSIVAGQTGKWSVTVVDESGWPLHVELFLYQTARDEVTQTGVPQHPPDSALSE